MEENGRGGRRITEFDRLFPVAVRNSIEAVLDLAAGDQRLRPHERNEVARDDFAEYYFKLWVSHSESIRLSVLESVDSAVKWERLRGFIQRLRPRFVHDGVFATRQLAGDPAPRRGCLVR